MSRGMMCEPNTSLPQKIDLDSMRREIKPEPVIDPHENDVYQVRPKISYSQEEYHILPKFSDQFEHTKETLSLLTNPYLAGRWSQFLDKVPEKYINVILYKDYRNLTKCVFLWNWTWKYFNFYFLFIYLFFYFSDDMIWYPSHFIRSIIKPRPKILNGQFYGVNNQLAPIPSNSDQMKKERMYALKNKEL